MNINQTIRRFLRTILYMVSLILVVFALASNSCKSPDEYAPDFGDLPPPSPPNLLYPAYDTMFVVELPNHYPISIELRWQPVEDAQYYQLQFSSDPEFKYINPVLINGTSSVEDINYDGQYYWHVRAYSSKWTWYTNWSQIWLFTTHYTPGFAPRKDD